MARTTSTFLPCLTWHFAYVFATRWRCSWHTFSYASFINDGVMVPSLTRKYCYAYYFYISSTVDLKLRIYICNVVKMCVTYFFLHVFVYKLRSYCPLFDSKNCVTLTTSTFLNLMSLNQLTLYMQLKLSFQMCYSKNYAAVTPWVVKILYCQFMVSYLAMWQCYMFGY